MNKHKNDELIAPLMKKYGLEDGVDIFTKEGKNGRVQYRIINRMGMDKIASKESDHLNIEWAMLPNSDQTHVYLRFTGEYSPGDDKPLRRVITSGEATEQNVQQEPKYLLAMAEARGRSRCILKLIGFYELGVYSEDEADAFRDFVLSSSGESSARPSIVRPIASSSREKAPWDDD
jgi:hypothetical protein